MAKTHSRVSTVPQRHDTRDGAARVMHMLSPSFAVLLAVFFAAIIQIV